MLNPGEVVNLEGETRDLGYGTEMIAGHYVWTGEVDTWGKLTFRSCDGHPTIYLFRDEILCADPVYSVRVTA